MRTIVLLILTAGIVWYIGVRVGYQRGGMDATQNVLEELGTVGCGHGGGAGASW